MKRLCVPVSRTGTLLRAIHREEIPIHCVIADRQCQALAYAEEAGIRTRLVTRDFSRQFDRRLYTWRIMEVLDDEKIEFIAMAGFMTILHGIILKEFDRKIINIHPSLLPAFKGKDAVADAHTYGVKVTGTTIHYAGERADEGEIIAQYATAVDPVRQTVEEWRERIKKMEQMYYPVHIRELMQNA